jgi:hypothetical protein
VFAMSELALASSRKARLAAMEEALPCIILTSFPVLSTNPIYDIKFKHSVNTLLLQIA